MSIRDGFVDTIGNTPLIKLRKASALTGCTILGKAEFLNPGGSVKDRAALAIVQDAEKTGALRPGGVLAVWSATKDTVFVNRLRRAGFAVDEVQVRARSNGMGAKHTIWFARSA